MLVYKWRWLRITGRERNVGVEERNKAIAAGRILLNNKRWRRKEVVCLEVKHYRRSRSLRSKCGQVERQHSIVAEHKLRQHWHVSASHTESLQWRRAKKNCKSLDCYQNLLSGWIKEMLVMPIWADVTHGSGKKTVLIAKVRHCWQYLSSCEKTTKYYVPCWLTTPKNWMTSLFSLGCSWTKWKGCLRSLQLQSRFGWELLSCSLTPVGCWSWCAGSKFNNCYSKESLLVDAPCHKRCAMCSNKRNQFCWEKQSLAKFNSCGECSSASTTPCTTTCSSKPVSNYSFSFAFGSLKEPKADEKESLFASLSTCGTKPAILSLVELYASYYVPRSLEQPPSLLIWVVQAWMSLHAIQWIDEEMWTLQHHCHTARSWICRVSHKITMRTGRILIQHHLLA